MVLPRLGARSLVELPELPGSDGGNRRRPARDRRVRIHVGWFAQLLIGLARAEGLVLGRRVFLSARGWQLAKTGSKKALLLIEHELVHVEQYQRLGFWTFLWRYGREYLAGRRKGLSHGAAYRAISFEQEARQLAAERLRGDREPATTSERRVRNAG